MQIVRFGRFPAALGLALVCLSPLAPLVAWQDSMQELAAAVLAVPAPDRSKVLEQRGVTPTHALLDAMVVIGGRRMSAGDFTGAGDAYEYTQALARSIHDDVSLGDTLLGLGQVYGRRADYERAHAVLTESLEIGTRLDNQRLIAASLNNLGIVYRLQADYEQARAMYRRVLAIAEAAHNEDQIGRALTNLGIIETYQGMYDAAVSHLQPSLDIATRLKNDTMILNATLNLGNVYYYQNNCALALDLYRRVLAEAERVRNPISTMSAL